MNPIASPETLAGDPVAAPAGPGPGMGVSGGLEAVMLSLRPHLADLDRFLRAQISAFEPEIREMADYCIDTAGKRI